MNIYSILETLDSIPNNPHYLKRYKKFILSKKDRIIDKEIKLEFHHILPKAEDMFPMFQNFKLYPENSIRLTRKEHEIAHLLLWKSFIRKSSCIKSFFLMYKSSKKMNTIIYNKIKIEFVTLIKEEIKSGTHNFISKKSKNKDRIQNGTHNFMKRPDGTSVASDSVKNGTHNLLKRSDGTSVATDRVKSGTNPFCYGFVSCLNKQGEFVKLPKTQYYSQQGNKQDWEFVSVKSVEAKLRKKI